MEMIEEMDDMNIDDAIHDEYMVILDDVEEVMISRDIKYMDKKKKDIYIKVNGEKIHTVFHITKFVSENNMIYIPKKIHYLFRNESIVQVIVIDEDQIKDVAMISILPISSEFYKQRNIADYVKYHIDNYSNKFVNNNTDISDLFKIVGITSRDNKHIEYGTIHRYPYEIKIVETHNADPRMPWHVKNQIKMNDAQKPVAKKEEKIDCSPVKTEIYKRRFVIKGEIVYVK